MDETRERSRHSYPNEVSSVGVYKIEEYWEHWSSCTPVLSVSPVPKSDPATLTCFYCRGVTLSLISSRRFVI